MEKKILYRICHCKTLYIFWKCTPFISSWKRKEEGEKLLGFAGGTTVLDLITNKHKTTYMGRDCLPVAMVLITSWRRCIQAVKMKMALDAIHTLILHWKSAQMLTWLRRWVINFAKDQKIFTGSNGMWSLQPSLQYGRRGKGKQSHNPLCAQIKLVCPFLRCYLTSLRTRKKNMYSLITPCQLCLN